ncbi:MAG: CocE/NonD family hydrolase [Planctomycetaceae bacterium]
MLTIPPLTNRLGQSIIALCVVFSAVCVHAEVTTSQVMVPMRDGVRLATDIYRDSAVEKAPVVLMRTPYNKVGGRKVAERFAAAGYIAVVQDCRGKFLSEGNFTPYRSEAWDGHDMIDWIGEQPWCAGPIGMWGASYVGATQWLAAAEHPEGLTTITPTATFSSFYRNLYLGGAVRHSLISTWAAGNSTKPAGVTANPNWNQILLHLPLGGADDQIGWPIPWLEEMLTHPSPDNYWKPLDVTDELPKLKLPIQHVVGYYDFFSRESVNNFEIMNKTAVDAETRKNQQLILGPWDHGTIGQRKVGDLDFGPEAQWDSAGATLEWFDRFLKQDPKVTATPLVPVRYFMLGENRWYEAETWPPEGVHETAFYLHSAGHANTRSGDGRITTIAATTDEPPDIFVADPIDPVPACVVTEARPIQAATYAPLDQRDIEDRQDVLAYTSEPLTKPLTFAGNARAEIFVSADTADADWVVKLIDVHPDGAAYNLAVGILRGRYRNSLMNPEQLVPSTVYPITIDLGPIAAQLDVGHSLRVDVCGAYFPLFDRNPNTASGIFGDTQAPSREMIYHTPHQASRIILPLRSNLLAAPKKETP